MYNLGLLQKTQYSLSPKDPLENGNHSFILLAPQICFSINGISKTNLQLFHMALSQKNNASATYFPVREYESNWLHWMCLGMKHKIKYDPYKHILIHQAQYSLRKGDIRNLQFISALP